MENFGIGETHLECRVQFLAPQYKNRHWQTEASLVEGHENVWMEVCDIREEDEKTGIV